MPEDRGQENDEVLLDREKALENVEGDEEFLKEIYTIFLEEVPERIEAFRNNIDDNNLEKIVSLAHSLKGVSLTVGAISCHELSREVEMAARNGDGEKVKQLYSRLEDLLRRIEKEIESMDL